MTSHGEYRSIFYAALVADDRYQCLTPEARSLWFHVRGLTGRFGVARLISVVNQLAAVSGYQPKTVVETLDELSTHKWLTRAGDVLWMHDALSFETNLSPRDPKHRKALHTHLASVKLSPAMQLQFEREYHEWFSESMIPKRSNEAPSEGPSKPLRRGVVTVTATVTDSVSDLTGESKQAEEDMGAPPVAETPTAEEKEMATRLAVAINAAIEKKWGEQPNPIRASHPMTALTARELVAAGVPVLVMQLCVAAWWNVTKIPRPPRSANYFLAMCLDAWSAQNSLGEPKAVRRSQAVTDTMADNLSQMFSAMPEVQS